MYGDRCEMVAVDKMADTWRLLQCKRVFNSLENDPTHSGGRLILGRHVNAGLFNIRYLTTYITLNALSTKFIIYYG